MHKIDLRRVDLNLLVTFDVLMSERSVTRAAERLARTQSAVSHALARLREQIGDPLLIKVGGRMKPSPFAETLLEEVRPVLRNIERMLTPPQPFEPAESTRSFRLAISDIAPSLVPEVLARVRREAPGVSVEWVRPDTRTLQVVAEGSVDIALVASSMKLPDGLVGSPAGELKIASFARKNHPAVASWGLAAWTRWPHVSVRLDDRVESPVTEAAQSGSVQRQIAAWVPHFSAVAPLLAATDLLATMPTIAMHGALEQFGLCALPFPLPVKPMPHRFVWSFRVANDPATQWMANILISAFSRLLKESAVPLAETNKKS